MDLFFPRLYGLKGHLIDLPFSNVPQQSLLNLLQMILTLVNTTEPLATDQMEALMTFVLSLCHTLHAFLHKTDLYKKGLKKLVFACPTQGKKLSGLPWLPSLLKGLSTMCDHLPNLRLPDFPIIIFDQNRTKIFQDNQQFIQQLRRQYPAQIWQLSSKQAIQLAKKMGIHNWIPAHHSHAFGYAASRNCVFLLAPVIHRAAQNGVCNFDTLIDMDKKALRQLFEEVVLGSTGEDAVLYMGEDDVAIPACNLFSDSLFVALHGQDYLCRRSFVYGRATHCVSCNFDFKNLQDGQTFLFAPPNWQEIPFYGGLKGRLSKPAFCLPLPHGCEESHVLRAFNHYRVPFEQSLVHLGGSRLPATLFPTSPVSGIANFLKQYIVYNLQIRMIDHLVDPTNRDNHCIFPWSDSTIRTTTPFKNLGELWAYAFAPQILAEVRQRFWNNMQAFSRINTDNQFIEQLRKLANLDLKLSVTKQLKNVYQKAAKDAQAAFALGQLYLQVYKQENWETALRQEMEIKFGPKSMKAPITKSFLQLITTIHGLEELYKAKGQNHH